MLIKYEKRTDNWYVKKKKKPHVSTVPRWCVRHSATKIVFCELTEDHKNLTTDSEQYVGHMLIEGYLIKYWMIALRIKIILYQFNFSI